MVNANSWNYYVLPGGVARVQAETVEIKDPKTDEWIAVSDTIAKMDLQRMLGHDGVKVSEDDAEIAYKKFTKR